MWEGGLADAALPLLGTARARPPNSRAKEGGCHRPTPSDVRDLVPPSSVGSRRMRSRALEPPSPCLCALLAPPFPLSRRTRAKTRQHFVSEISRRGRGREEGGRTGSRRGGACHVRVQPPSDALRLLLAWEPWER